MSTEQAMSNTGAGALVAAAKRLAPWIRDLAPQIDQDGRLPRELVDAFVDAGFFRMFVPRDYGGLEVEPVTQARVVEEIAAADGSAGWCVMIAAQTAAFCGLIAEEEARLICQPDTIMAGTARPIGRAVRVSRPADGYRVSGRWPFASGSSHANWFAGECMVYEEDGSPVLDERGEHVSRMVMVPRDDVVVHETWDTLGLRGTASNDFSIERAFVPQQRGFQMLVTPPAHPWPLFKVHPLIFINHGAHSLGVARAAIETAIDVARRKTGWGGVPLKDLPRVQAAIGQASVMVDAAARHLYGSAAELWQLALDGKDDPELRAKVRLATSHATTTSLQAVDMLHSLLATGAIFKTSPLERQFRDIHTAAAHVMIGPLTYEAGGRVLMGLSPEFPFF